MSKVLIISPDRISESMSGPGVRYWNFSIQLAKFHEVTLVAKNMDFLTSPEFNTIHIKDITGSLEKFVLNFDVVILQGLTLFEMPFLKKIKVPLVIDLYDPFIFEILAQEEWTESSMQLYNQQLQILLEQIQYGDYFICASEKQRDFWIGMLAATMRINPQTFKVDPSFKSLIGVVPFGLPNIDPVKERTVLKGVLNGIKENDKVVIWWGGLWDWLDPKTLVRAMSIIEGSNPNIKCVIVGVKHPDPAFVAHKIVNEVQQLSHELNLTNRTVFFLDWIKYEERMNYLLECDVGISLHFSNIETRYSFRTRILDYLWSKLPMVVTKGDILADIISSYGLGEIVDERDHIGLAQKIIKVIENDEYRKNFDGIRANYYWSQIIGDLNGFCSNPTQSVDKLYFSKIKRGKSPSKISIYLNKGTKLLLKGDFKSLYLKAKSKISKHY